MIQLINHCTILTSQFMNMYKKIFLDDTMFQNEVHTLIDQDDLVVAQGAEEDRIERELDLIEDCQAEISEEICSEEEISKTIIHINSLFCKHSKKFKIIKIWLFKLHANYKRSMDIYSE